MSSRLAPICLVPFALACAQRPPSGGGQSGEEWDNADEAAYGCEEVSRVTLPAADAAPNGVVPQDVINIVNGVFPVALTYADGSSTTLSLGLSTSGDAVWVDLEPPAPTGGEEIAWNMVCEDELRFDLQVDFQTADGLLSERLNPELMVGADGVGRWWASVDPEALIGAWSPTLARDGFDPSAWDEVTLSIEGEKGLGDPTGSVNAQATKVEGEGPDGTATAAMFEVASYGPPSER